LRKGQDKPFDLTITGEVLPLQSISARGYKMPAQSPASMDDNNRSDIELVDRLLRGAPGAFDLFYRRHERLIYHCIRMRADAADVTDLFQSFFERLVERDYHVLKLWQRGASLPIYLSKVIRNFVIDFHRKKRRWQVPVGGLPELDSRGNPRRSSSWPLSFVDEKGDETISTTVVLRELRRVGLQAWAELDGRDRFLMCGKFHRDLTNEAMALRLKLTEGALRTALSRAQVRLLAGVKELAPEYFPA
jgi:RNA polymerase sigma factor (sigma-70 family)